MAYLSTKRALPLVVALILCLGAAVAPSSVVAAAVDTPVADNADTPQQATPHHDVSVDVAGVTVFVDPETGRLRQPTADQAQALASALRRHFTGMDKSITSPKFERRGDGTLMYRSAPEFMNYTIGLASPNGDTTTTCAPNLEQATAVLENPQPVLEAARAAEAEKQAQQRGEM